jgi:hypothetical protein
MLKRLITIALIAISSLPPALGQFVNAPDLNCISIVSGTTGDILLEWSLPSNSCGAFNSYEIFRSTNINGPYTLIHTETNQFATSFTDNTVNGNTTIYYYYLVSDYSCPGYSFLHSDTLDNLPPEPPVFNYVTVVNNAAVLNWAPGPSPETYGYIVYLLIPANQPLDTIYGKLNTTYTHLGAAINSGPVTYSVSAIDSCLHTGGFTAAHHTIYLEESIDRCDGSITLHWNSYDNWTNGVLKYEVFVSQNGNPPLIEQTLPPDSFTCKISGFNDGRFNLCIRCSNGSGHLFCIHIQHDMQEI